MLTVCDIYDSSIYINVELFGRMEIVLKVNLNL